MESYENLAIDSDVNVPITLLEPRVQKRRYLKREQLIIFAESIYKNTGRGTTVRDLIKYNLVNHKMQGQLLLKHAVRSKTLFTLQRRRPQWYYPISLKSEISKDFMSKITPKQVTELYPIENQSTILSKTDINSMINQTLTGYVLPMMPVSLLYIHKLQLKTKLTPQTYMELPVTADRHNKAKKYEEHIGNSRITYLFYPNGTVMASIESSNNPLKLETELDRSHILTFLGQVRDRLIIIVCDSHEKIVPKILDWGLIECDVNKDIHVSDWFQVIGLKMQVSHLDHLFRVYIKSMRKDTVCRVEESKNKVNKPVVEALNDIFNPYERIENLINRRFNELTSSILTKLHTPVMDNTEL